MEKLIALTFVAAIVAFVTAYVVCLEGPAAPLMTHPKRPRNHYQLAKSIVDIATKERPAYLPSGGSFDPRLAIIKGKPGPLTICEIAMEVSV